jgi:cell division protein FtsA
MSFAPMIPRLRPLPARKSALLSVLDIGTTKIACLIARLMPVETSEVLRGRTHRCRILGIGHQRSRGIKAGVVIDMEDAENAVRLAVDAAERMAGVLVESVIVSVTGGRLGSQHYDAKIAVGGRAVGDHDVQRVLAAATDAAERDGRAVLHSLPIGFSLDGARGIRDPKGMIGDLLGVDLHLVGSETSAVRNLMLAVERCHLGVEALVATPYAAGLSSLVDDESEMGVGLIEMGGGTTSVGVFAAGRLMHADAIAVGGHHVTTDIARGLTTRLSDAERLKTLYGSCLTAPSDERDTIALVHSGEDSDQPHHVPKSQLTRIIRPRIEEILELVRDRLKQAGFGAHAGRRLVLTGGASQLTGLSDLARAILSPQVRIGRPLGIQGLPESAKSPAFAAAVGLLVYPQVAGIEHFEPHRQGLMRASGSDGYIAKVGRWLKDSF